MKYVFAIVSITILAASNNAVGESSRHSTWIEHTTLTSLDLSAIERALPELHRLRPNWSAFNISVAQTDDSLLVTFFRHEDDTSITVTGLGDNDKTQQVITSIPRNPDQLVVKLDSADLRVIAVWNGTR